MPIEEPIPFEPSTLCQIGIVVKNIDETVKYYGEVFGIGLLRFWKSIIPTHVLRSEGGYRGKRAFAKMGPLQSNSSSSSKGRPFMKRF